MITWKTASDDIFLQAHLNHVIRVWGNHPNIPEDKIQLVIERAKKHYERFPDDIEVLEEEIAKLLEENNGQS